MSVHFTFEELAVISFYGPENGRLSVIRAISMELPYMEDKSVTALLRGVLAKLNLCSDMEFRSLDFAAAAASFG